jgi:YidC/Oxa1 family membrane protein insertase
MPIGFVWQTVLETPLINFMVLLTAVLFGSYGLAILAFTVISRVLTFPLTLRTLHSTRRMQELQPKLQEIQKKYADPKRRSQETMKLYKEAGVNPLGCLGGQLIQFPLFIALYQVIRITLGGTPESLVYLESRLYDVDLIRGAIPLSESFLSINLGQSGNLPLTVLVAGSTWLQQRISMSRNQASASSQQAQMNQMMLLWMPLMFGWFGFVSPAGLPLYWLASTVIGIVLQWVFVGPGDFTWGSLIPALVRSRLGMGEARRPSRPASRSASGPPALTSAAGSDDSSEARSSDGTGSRSQRSRRRGRGRQGPPSTRTEPRPGRDRGRPRR